MAGKCVVLFIDNGDICDEYEINDNTVEEATEFLGINGGKADFDIKTIVKLMLDNKNLVSKNINAYEAE